MLAAAGVEATGTITDDDPLPTLEAEVGRIHAGEVVIVTEPHAVQDTFHTDWASEARERLGVPVLHVYTGTTRAPRLSRRRPGPAPDAGEAIWPPPPARR